MKTSKLPTQLAKNASKLHKHIGKLLVELFPHNIVRQEYPVSKVNPSFKSNREKFDWVVLGINVVVEVHGQQHYKPVCFGGITIDEAKIIFRKRQEVDWEKQEAAFKAGWAYLVVKYTETKLSAEGLLSRVSEAIEESKTAEEIKSARPKAKIQSRGFQKHEGKYKWPKRKIQTRKLR